MKSGFLVEKDLHVVSSLINSYAKSGDFHRANALFSHILNRDVICWNGLISGYARHGHHEEALTCFHRMQHESLCPNVVTFVCILKACGTIGAPADKGESIHARVAVYDWVQTNVLFGNALLGMYAKSGALARAENAFFQIPNRDVVSWTTLIGVYVQHGCDDKAIECLSLMQLEHIPPNLVTFSCSLKACANIGALDKGIEMHAEMARNGLLNKNTNKIIIGTALINMYAKCGALTNAYEVFCLLPSHDVASWNALITGHVWHGYAKESLNFFEGMKSENISPDTITFVCILKACADLGELEKGQEIHAEICRKGLLFDNNTSIGNALVDMYSQCCALTMAQEVFDELPVRDIVSWTTLMSGYVAHGLYMEALSCFTQVRNQNLPVNAITIVCALKACTSIRVLEKGKELLADIFPESFTLVLEDIFVATALVNLYANMGELGKSKELLDQLLVRDVPAWNALIAGYIEHEELSGDTIYIFRRMRLEGLLPTTFTFACIFKACSSIGAIATGKELHMEIIEAGLHEEEKEEVCLVGNALVDMYSKCGIPTKAQYVFNELPVKTTVSWTTLISAYGQLGQVDHVIYIFSRMIELCIEPDAATFTILLNACSHGGLLEEGHMYFMAMRQIYGIVPTLEHHTCMIDLFGRVGNFDHAMIVIGKTPTSDCLPLWVALLGSCTIWGNVQLGIHALKHVVGQNEKHYMAHASMRNTYASAGRREEL